MMDRDKLCVTSDFRSYRQGNPVVNSGKVRFIKEVIKNNDRIVGYSVHEDGNMVTEEQISPLSINDGFLRGIKSCKRLSDGSYVFNGNENRIDFFPDSHVCTVQLTLNTEITNIHELMNLVKDVCNIDLHYYRLNNTSEQ